MKAMKKPNEALDFFRNYVEHTPRNPEGYTLIGEVQYSDFKDLKKAIECYERALNLGDKSFHTYSMLGHLYSTLYRDQGKEKQLEYLTKAYELKPTDRIAVKNLAYVTGKFGMLEEADKLYSQLLTMNPQHTDLHSYGAYLVRHQRFEEGFKYLRHRFWKEDLEGKYFPDIFFGEYGWTPDKDVRGKKVIAYYEQGFGDTMMFARFIPQLKEMCEKVSVIVQPQLLDLFKDSKLGVEIYIPRQIDSLEFDYVIPMMDLPLVCGMTKAEDIPLAKGYLSLFPTSTGITSGASRGR